MTAKKIEVDLVYLWVDGNDPEWLKKKLTFTGEFKEGSEVNCKARYENNDELKYSLRSAEKFAPWIRRIFIVTDNQTPEWLDTSNPKIQIVDHSEILPPEALPCFNSSVLEYFLYKIPGLAEHFLFANDDMLFGDTLTPDYFFAPDGFPIVRLKKKSMSKLRWRTKKLLGTGVGHYRTMVHCSAMSVDKLTGRFIGGVPHHNIDTYLKSDYKLAVEEVFGEQARNSMTHHIRTDGDLHRSAFSFYALATRHAHLKYVHRNDSLRINVLKPNFMEYFLEYKPKLFCLNDDQRVTSEDRIRIKPFLEELFPEKSKFEK